MRRFLYFLSCILLPAAAAAQESPRWYARALAGFAAPFLSQTLAAEGGLYSGSVTAAPSVSGGTVAYRLQRASFGSGAWATAAVGRRITDRLAVEVGISGALHTRRHTYTYRETDDFGGYREYNLLARADHPLLLIPALQFSPRWRKALQPYGRIGLVLPLRTAVALEETDRYAAPASVQNYAIHSTSRYELRAAPGAQASLGLSIALSGHIALQAEATATALSLYTRRATYTGYTYNGQDWLDVLPSDVRTTEYAFNFETTAGAAAYGTGTRPAFSMPFSSAGLSVGVQIRW